MMEQNVKPEYNLSLKNARIAKGWTQQKLADMIADELTNEDDGVSIDKQSVGRWERREVFPSSDVLPTLCKVLGKNCEELGLLWELYHPVNGGKKPDLLQSEPNFTQEETESVSSSAQAPNPTQKKEKITPKQYFRKASLPVIIFSLVLISIVVGGSVLVYLRQTSANQGPTSKVAANSVIGSLLYHYQLPKLGNYETLVNALAWSQNGSYLACASGDEVARIFTLGTEKEVTVFHGHSQNVNSIVWLPNGTQVASASTDQTVQIWDAFTGHVSMIFPSAASVWAVAVSPDGNMIAWAGKDGITEVWQITPQVHLFTYTGQAGSGGIWGLAFSHDGKLIAAGDNIGDIQIFDAKNGKTVLNYTEQTKTIYGLNWSPNDRYIASASGDDLGGNGSVRIWNASNGKTAYVYEYNMLAMQAVSWSPDGSRIASASAGGTVQVWDAFTGNHPFIYKRHSGTVYTVAWSPDGNKIASGDANGSIQVWQAQ
jgi:Tol biopolymer transport system component/transcriptional regulator with XRE-family HTH domain